MFKDTLVINIRKGNFYHRQVPKRFYRDIKEETFVKIRSKLQLRYSGAYLINKIINNIIYKAIMHGKNQSACNKYKNYNYK